MVIKTKCIKAPQELSDGCRISVMSSHTLNDGVTHDASIKPDMYDLHIPELAPPRKLLGDYYKRGLSWENYEQRYLEHIRKPHIKEIIEGLASHHDVVTFMCIEETDEFCHRRLLKEEIRRILNVT